MLTKEILSLQHPIVKHLVLLRSNKAYREECKSLVVTGINALHELTATHTLLRLLVLKGTQVPFSYQADETLIVSQEILKKITGLETPESIIAEISQPKESDLSKCHLVLVLDKINDPGNLGTLLRTALALGWDGVFHLEGSVDLFNDKVLRASKGAIFRLPFFRGDEKALLSLLLQKQWALLAADPKGVSITQPLPNVTDVMLAIGNESQGLSTFVAEKFQRVALPMNGPMESLNAAIAGGILMFILKDSHANS